MAIVTYFFRWNPLSPPHRLLFPISSKGYFICTFPTDGTAHTTTFVGPVMDHCLEQKIAQIANAPTMQAWADDPNLYRLVFSLLPELHPTPLRISLDWYLREIDRNSNKAIDIMEWVICWRSWIDFIAYNLKYIMCCVFQYTNIITNRARQPG